MSSFFSIVAQLGFHLVLLSFASPAPHSWCLLARAVNSLLSPSQLGFHLVLLSLASPAPQSWCLLARAVKSLLSPSRVFYAALVTLLQGCLSDCVRLYMSFSPASGSSASRGEADGCFLCFAFRSVCSLSPVLCFAWFALLLFFWFLSCVSSAFLSLLCYSGMGFLVSVVDAPAASIWRSLSLLFCRLEGLGLFLRLSCPVLVVVTCSSGNFFIHMASLPFLLFVGFPCPYRRLSSRFLSLHTALPAFSFVLVFLALLYCVYLLSVSIAFSAVMLLRREFWGSDFTCQLFRLS